MSKASRHFLQKLGILLLSVCVCLAVAFLALQELSDLKRESQVVKNELAMLKNSVSQNREQMLALQDDFSQLRVAIEKPAQKIRLIGHRGGDTSKAPENTLRCLSSEFSKGVWGCEVDIRTTKDGAVVLMHDKLVDRTTDGVGPVAGLSLETVRKLDAGSWKSTDFVNEKVPMLDEALRVMKASQVFAYLDIKAASAASVQKAVKVSGFPEDKLVFLTFSDEQSAAFVEAFPTAAIYRSLWGHAYDIEKTDSQLMSFAHSHVKGVTIRSDHFSSEYVQAIHKAGLKVAVVGYGVSRRAKMNDYFLAGVDELWLDDLQTHVSEVNDGSGVLSIKNIN